MLKENNWIIVILIALAGSAVSYIRKHRNDKFSVRKLADGMIVAAFTGIIVNCVCIGLKVEPMLSSAAVAIAGYCGGSLLDATEKSIITLVEDGLAKITGVNTGKKGE
ncbi:MAG: phage holin family protein [Cloacibacillus sp.]